MTRPASTAAPRPGPGCTGRRRPRGATGTRTSMGSRDTRGGGARAEARHTASTPGPRASQWTSPPQTQAWGQTRSANIWAPSLWRCHYVTIRCSLQLRLCLLLMFDPSMCISLNGALCRLSGYDTVTITQPSPGQSNIWGILHFTLILSVNSTPGRPFPLQVKWQRGAQNSIPSRYCFTKMLPQSPQLLRLYFFKTDFESQWDKGPIRQLKLDIVSNMRDKVWGLIW